jgi:hypothetical protein
MSILAKIKPASENTGRGFFDSSGATMRRESSPESSLVSPQFSEFLAAGV